jgi:scyllo-inositol 2-dehydrogenase (NADP+)
MTLLIVGGGKMGMSHLALCTPYVGKDNIALCDTQFLTRKFFQYLGYKAFASVDQAAAKLDRIAGIVVATPTSSHAALGSWALERKIPVFIEKPLTLDVAASDELTRIAADCDVPAQVGFVMRYVASFQRLRALVRDGDLGRIHGYSASMRGNVMTAPPAEDHWQGNFARGGGCLNEYGPHIIDLCRFIFGPVTNVSEAKATHVHSVNADDRTEVEWTHAAECGDEVTGQLLIDWADSSKRKSVIEFIVDFEAARLRVDNSTVDVEWRTGPVETQDKRSQIDFSVDPANVDFYLRGEEFSLELEDFLTTIGYGEPRVRPSLSIDTIARLEDGREVDKLIDLIARKAGLK